jgi:hypothetical protein
MSDDLPEIDVRTVAVVWADDGEPQVDWSGCSIYEAIGLLRVALVALEADAADALDTDDE